jgi:uroporphyrinogen-III synthase
MHTAERLPRGFRLIVTRPEPQASQWAQALAQRCGLETLALPLIETHALPLSADAHQAADAWMFVSAAAVDAWWPALPPAQQVPAVWVTGGGSAQAVRAHAPHARIVLPEQASQWDSEGLWATLVAQGLLRGVGRVLVLRGRDEASANGGRPQEGQGREWLSEQLRALGIAVQTLAVYERRLPRWTALEHQAARAALDDGSVWLLTSSQSVDHLLALLGEPGALCKGAALATHPRIAQRARDAGFASVSVCEPGLDAIALWCENNRLLS